MSEAYRHSAVLLNEALDALQIKPAGVYVDGTFGRGGHSQKILERMNAQGRLIALDRDPAAIAAGRTLADPRLKLIHAPFGELAQVLKEEGVGPVDGVLLDLGVSSPQLDEAQRGFSFRFDAPLDMRMDTSCGETAAQWLAQVSQRQLGEVIKDYGEERFAHAIAKALVAARAGGALTSTRQLAQVVAAAVPTREKGQHPATRTFQAIRIHVNQELAQLALVLPQAVAVLAQGARLAVISFHSLEDRIVKRFLRDESRPAQLPARLPLRAAELPAPRLRLIGKSVPGAEEIAANPRARSAVMRVAQRTDSVDEPPRDRAGPTRSRRSRRSAGKA